MDIFPPTFSPPENPVPTRVVEFVVSVELVSKKHHQSRIGFDRETDFQRRQGIRRSESEDDVLSDFFRRRFCRLGNVIGLHRIRAVEMEEEEEEEKFGVEISDRMEIWLS